MSLPQQDAAAGIVDLSATRRPSGPLSTEILVIGSGCGGATAAWDLAAAGRQVLVLEEGGDFTGSALTQRDGQMIDQLYMERGGRATEDLSISILQGRVLGGGGVINQCDVVGIKDELLDVWRSRFGLSDFSASKLAPHVARARRDLSANRIDADQINRANALLQQGAKALGLRGEVLEHNRVGCEELGGCTLGCPANAKRNPRFVAIPGALKAGARFFIRGRATRIDDSNKALKRVQVRTLDAKGHRETGSFEIRARVVIVAANAIATAQLLLRSGIGNEHVGRHLTLQPQLPIVAEFDERIDGFAGIPQSYAVIEHEFVHQTLGLWGFRIEGIMATPGLVASLLPLVGQAGKQIMSRYAHYAASLLLAPDAPSGRVQLRDAGRPLVRYQHQEDHKARIRQAIKLAARVYLAAGARTVFSATVPLLQFRKTSDLDQVDQLSLAPATASFVSAHQQGSVRFAPSAKLGGARPDGLVYGTRDIYVFDSSGFPTSASSHTMLPIISTSHYLSAQLNSHLN
ncbi:MAG: GMC family oxidoreductase [Deltaproteobacteria bacterium]|nr:GMC family oxidoreductase [Deltaproteobacteria bacterium]